MRIRGEKVRNREKRERERERESALKKEEMLTKEKTEQTQNLKRLIEQQKGKFILFQSLSNTQVVRSGGKGP